MTGQNPALQRLNPDGRSFTALKGSHVLRSASHLSYGSLKGHDVSRRLLLRSCNKSRANGATGALELYLGGENDAKVSQILLKAPLLFAAAAQRKPSLALKEVNGSTTSPGWMFFSKVFVRVNWQSELSGGWRKGPRIITAVPKKTTDVFWFFLEFELSLSRKL